MDVTVMSCLLWRVHAAVVDGGGAARPLKLPQLRVVQTFACAVHPMMSWYRGKGASETIVTVVGMMS